MYESIMLLEISLLTLNKYIFIECRLGATSIVKIGEVRLSDEIGGEGLEISKKPNFIITIRYEIPTFSSVGGGGGLKNFS